MWFAVSWDSTKISHLRDFYSSVATNFQRFQGYGTVHIPRILWRHVCDSPNSVFLLLLTGYISHREGSRGEFRWKERRTGVWSSVFPKPVSEPRCWAAAFSHLSCKADEPDPVLEISHWRTANGKTKTNVFVTQALWKISMIKNAGQFLQIYWFSDINTEQNWSVRKMCYSVITYSPDTPISPGISLL